MEKSNVFIDQIVNLTTAHADYKYAKKDYENKLALRNQKQQDVEKSGHYYDKVNQLIADICPLVNEYNQKINDLKKKQDKHEWITSFGIAIWVLAPVAAAVIDIIETFKKTNWSAGSIIGSVLTLIGSALIVFFIVLSVTWLFSTFVLGGISNSITAPLVKQAKKIYEDFKTAFSTWSHEHQAELDYHSFSSQLKHELPPVKDRSGNSLISVPKRIVFTDKPLERHLMDRDMEKETTNLNAAHACLSKAKTTLLTIIDTSKAVPEIYRTNHYALSRMLELNRNGRADTRSEIINLYEQLETDAKRHQEQLQILNETKKYQAELLEIRRTQVEMQKQHYENVEQKLDGAADKIDAKLNDIKNSIPTDSDIEAAVSAAVKRR